MVACTDPALTVIQAVSAIIRDVFDPESVCPPDGASKGAPDVKFLATDNQGIPPTLIPRCGDPLFWVRLDRRYRSRPAEFPAAVVKSRPCDATDDTIPAIVLEVGVGRCVNLQAKKWNPDDELVALDDSWRIATVLDVARCRLQSKNRLVVADTVAPLGPEGEMRAWTGMLYVQLEKVT